MKRSLFATLLLVTSCYSFDTAAPLRSGPAPLERADKVETVEASQATFTELARVFSHPRCGNCHPGGDSPLQKNGQMHNPPVRGFATEVAAATDCGICHQTSWNPQTRIPGAPHWELAPRSMQWAGRTDRQICEQIKDPARNGGKTLDEVHKHLAEDELVAWGWDPGPRLEPAPGSAEAFAALFKAWVDSGAHCP